VLVGYGGGWRLGMSTKIEWTHEVWNPIVGCSKVSPGCENCYAERIAKRLKAMGLPRYRPVVDENGWTGKTVMTSYDTMEKPYHWKKPRLIFVCSMSDLFHENVSFFDVNWIIEVIRYTPRHTFQILTKRAERMADYFSTHKVPDNVWVGVTAENQAMADKRIPYLLQVPAKVRFVSVEPMLGPVDLTKIKLLDAEHPERGEPPVTFDALKGWYGGCDENRTQVHWVICGCESGPGARPIHPAYMRDLRDQVVMSKVPFFLKQMKVDGKLVKMPELDYVVWDQMPELT